MVRARRIPANACHPSVVEQARVLVTGSLWSYPAIAWEVGVSVNTLLNWKTRYGWVRPPAKRRERGVVQPEEVAGRPRRFSRGGRGKGRYYAPDVVEAVRRMVEESVLTQGAIAARAGISHETIRMWTKRHGWVRPEGTTIGPDGMVAVRLCERSEATQGISASVETSWVASPDQVRGPAAPPRDDGVGDTPMDRRWAERLREEGWHGGAPWRDALLPRGFVVPQNRRASNGKSRPYLRPVVERVRELVEGTGLSQAAIAARTGVGSATVGVWMRERGWRRPLDACRASQAVPADRAGLSARLSAAFARVAELAEEARSAPRTSDATASVFLPPCGEGGPSEAEGRMGVAPPDSGPGCSRSHPHPGSTLRVGSALPTRGRDGASPPTREDEAAALARLARDARRLARLYDRAGLARLASARRLAPGDPWEPIRLSAAARGPRHHPRGEDVVAQARHAWERSEAPRDVVAAQVGVAPGTLSRWAQSGGWVRPVAAPSPYGIRARYPGFRARRAQREEASRLLDEGERMLEGAGPLVLTQALGLLRSAARVVGAPLAPGLTPPGR